MRKDRLVTAAALLLGVLPLWVSRHLPMVDLPQHLHLISVLNRLDDATTLYPEFFAARHTLTPYLGYYYAVSALQWVLPLDAANRLFLSAYVVGLPLALAFLLRSLGRSTWPALLALPFGYGDSFAWGFINYLASQPVAVLCCGLFVRALVDVPRRRAWAGGLAACLVAVLLFHVQSFFFLALGLPWLLLTTPLPEDAPGQGLAARLKPRAPALLGVVPGVAMFLTWAGLRLSQPTEVVFGQMWKAWGPLFSPQNLAYKDFAQNRDELLPLLGNILNDGSDRWPLYAVGLVAAVALAAGFLARGPRTEGPLARWRMLGLGLLALALYFLMPLDIRGYIYYLNPRYAHLAAALLVSSLPVVRPTLHRPLLWASAACALVLALVLGRGFLAFSREASEWDVLAEATPPRARVLGIIYLWDSRVVHTPAFLHSAAELARARGGIANFSFASTPHSPLRYRREPPPSYSSEWKSREFNYDTLGAFYDAFLVRGTTPEHIFGARLQSELRVAAHAGESWLVVHR